jgi:hypothetical protein
MRVVGSIHTICFLDMLCLLQVQTKAASNDKSRTRIMTAKISITGHRNPGTDAENNMYQLCALTHRIPELSRGSRGKFAGEMRRPTIDWTVRSIGTRHHTRVITSAVVHGNSHRQ